MRGAFILVSNFAQGIRNIFVSCLQYGHSMTGIQSHDFCEFDGHIRWFPTQLVEWWSHSEAFSGSWFDAMMIRVSNGSSGRRREVMVVNFNIHKVVEVSCAQASLGPTLACLKWTIKNQKRLTNNNGIEMNNKKH